MTAIAADVQRPSLGHDKATPYPVKDDAIIFAGGLTCLDAGLLVDGAATAGFILAGVAREGLDNTNGGDGVIVGTQLLRCVEVQSGRPFLFACAGSPIPGAPVWLVDNNTVTTVAGAVFVGRLVKPDIDGGSGLWYVQIEGAATTGEGQAAVVAPLTGTLTGTANSALVDVAATAANTAGGSTPTAAQVDTGIATAVASIVTGVNEQNKEFQTTINAILTALKNAGIMAS